jgi:serine/threonine protein kinase/WD40 repeat protein
MPTFDDEEAVFNAALDREAGHARSAFLDEACAGDAEFRRRIELLLSAYSDGQDLTSPGSMLGRFKPPSVLEKPEVTVGKYELLEQIGEGGMGDVYLARRIEGDRRTVALKVIKPGMDSRQVMARFELERTSLSKMDHPHIAQFIEAGMSDEGRAYFVMELVRGLPLTEYCDRQRLPVTQRLKLVVDLCLAVEHAHSKGLVHRDLKPGNVLVTEVGGEPVVKVIDFGVAKALDSELNDRTIFTRPTQFIGTPIYMSPEQARWCPDVDIRSDVYSIGVLLYELLSGSPPTDKAILRSVGLEELRRIVQEEEAAPPSDRIASLPTDTQATVAAARGATPKQLKAQVRGDLDWITLMALAKDRTARYATPGELAQDLNRYLNRQVVHARAPSLWTRGRKWASRHVVQLRSIAAVMAISAIGVAAYWSQTAFRNVGTSAAAADLAAQHLQYCTDLQQAWFQVQAGDRASALSLLKKHAPGVPGHPEVGFEWHLIHDLAAAKPLRVFQGALTGVLAADISPDGRWVACGDRSGLVIIWDADTGHQAHTLQVAGGEVTTVKFSPDGKWLAWSGMDRIVHLMRTGSWEEVHRFEKHSMTVCRVAWSPDGKWLASAGRDLVVHIWDVEHVSHHRALTGHADAVRCVAWSPDGQILASTNGTQGIILWNTKTWQQLRVVPSADTATLSIAFSPNGTRVAFGGYGGVLSVAFMTDPSLVLRIMAKEQIWSLEYFSDDRILAGLTNGHVQLFRVLVKRPPHVSRLVAEWFTPVKGGGTCRATVPIGAGEEFLVARQEDTAVELVRAADLLGYRPPMLRYPEFIMGTAGPYVLTWNQDTGTTIVRNIHNRESARIDVDPENYCPPAYSAVRKLFAVGAKDQHIHFFNSDNWTAVKRVPAPAPLTALSFSKEGRLLAASCVGKVSVVDLNTGDVRPVAEPSDQGDPLALFSPADDLLAVADRGSFTVKLFRGPEFKPIAALKTISAIHCIQFNAHGDLLAVGEGSGASLWHVPSMRAAGMYRSSSGEIRALAFSPNGRTIVSVADNGVDIWDASTALSYCTFETLPFAQPWLTFDDDSVLLTGELLSGVYQCFGGPWATDDRFQSPAPSELLKRKRAE